MNAKKAKTIRKAFKTEKQLDVLGPADRRVGTEVEKNVYRTNANGEKQLVKVKRQTMVNMTKNAYRKVKKQLITVKKK